MVSELYDYYCVNIDEVDIATTVRSPNLPFHINCSVHDVASVFKRLLAGLPGGILGHVSLFDALVSIHRMFSAGGQGPNVVASCNLVRARLIALAIEAVPSPLQRELICAVFGLLCLVGRAAEAAAAREDVYSSRFPNSELMGFGPLGIIFGPLLLGDFLGHYSSETSEDAISSFFLPPNFSGTPSPRSRTDRRRKSAVSDKRSLIAASLTLDKVLLANNIAEMLVTNWTLVVEQMDSLAIMRKQSLTQHPFLDAQQRLPRVLRPSRSETFSDFKQRSTAPRTSRSRRSPLRMTRSESVSFVRTNTSRVAAVESQQPPSWPLSRRQADGAPESFASRKRSATYGQASEVAAAAPADITTTFVKQAVAALSPTQKGAPSVDSSLGLSAASRPARFPQRNQDSVTPPLDSGLTVPSWRAKLKPVDTTVQNTDKSIGNPRSPMDKPLRRMPPDRGVASSRRSSFGGPPTSGSDGSPSKTAALIARIISPRTTAAPATAQVTKTPERSVAFDRTGKNLTSAGRGNALAALPLTDLDGANFSESRKMWPPKTNTPSITPTDQRGTANILTPAPTGRWRARTLPTTIDGSPWDRPSIGSPNLPRQSRNTENQPITPSRNKQQNVARPQLMGANEIIRHKPGFGGAMSLNTGGQVLGKGSGMGSPAQQPPLSEIKNEAKAMHRTQSKNSGTTPKRTWADVVVSVTPDGSGAKSTAGGTVKAMAAMFDSAVVVPATATIPLSQTPPVPTRDAPRTPNSISKYMTNNSPAKIGSVTPPFISHTQRGLPAAKSVDEAGCSASMRDLVRERRRLRLSRSEGRNAPTSNAPLSPGRRTRTEAARSAERNTIVVDTRVSFAKMATGRSDVDGAEVAHVVGELDTSMGRNEAQKARPQVLDRSRLAEESPLLRRGIEIPRTPVQYGASPVLQAQLQDLRHQLEAKTVECAGWKKRAEVAERAVAELERYASKLYMVGDDMGNGDDDTDTDSDSGSSSMTVVVHSRMTNEAVLRVMM